MLTALDTANFHWICLPGQPSGMEGGVLLTFLFTCVMQALQMHNESASDFPVKLMITLSLYL